MNLPIRKKLPHDIPTWVEQGAVFFITVCCHPKGVNQLCIRETAKVLGETIGHRHNIGEWWVRLFLLMPDHCHALISFGPQVEMQKSVTQWKRFTSTKLKVHWQRDFFDHRVRDNENLDEKEYYIRMNPVRKALCQRVEDWPYAWTSFDFSQ